MTTSFRRIVRQEHESADSLLLLFLPLAHEQLSVWPSLFLRLSWRRWSGPSMLSRNGFYNLDTAVLFLDNLHILAFAHRTGNVSIPRGGGRAREIP